MRAYENCIEDFWRRQERRRQLAGSCNARREAMLDLAEIITLGALNREETRGSHFRLDYKKRNDNDWLKHTQVTCVEGKPLIRYSDVDAFKYKPEERIY